MKGGCSGDGSSAGYYNIYGCFGNYDNQISSVFGIQSGETNSEVCTIHWKSSSVRGIRNAGYILPEECQHLSGSHGIPELIAIAAVVALHLWKRQMLLSIAGGTIIYMLLVQFVF